jgi:hypothetical protein
MRDLLKRLFAWMLLVLILSGTVYAIHSGFRTVLAYVQQELGRQFTQGAL